MSGPVILTALALLALAVWVYLLLARGGFWRWIQRDSRDVPEAEPSSWPSVVAVVPARNEADMIPQSLASLLRQSYAGPFCVILVDDNSDDGTLVAAREVAAGCSTPLTIVRGAPLPAGWPGKLWALRQGIERAEASVTPPDYLLLTDA